MSYKAIDVAKHVITYAAGKSCPVTNLKLQKILYFLWIDFYRERKDYLYDDMIQAWKFGPVIPEVYYAYCHYAAWPINKSYDDVLSKDDSDLLNPFIDEYMKESAYALVERSHSTGKPWDEVYAIHDKNIIPFQKIIEMECEA